MNKARQQAEIRKYLALLFLFVGLVSAANAIFDIFPPFKPGQGPDTLAGATGFILGRYFGPVLWLLIAWVFWGSSQGKKLEAESQEMSDDSAAKREAK